MIILTSFTLHSLINTLTKLVAIIAYYSLNCFLQYHWESMTNFTFISQVKASSSVTKLFWTEGSEYVYGINGTSDDADVSISKYSLLLLDIMYYVGYCIKDRGLC